MQNQILKKINTKTAKIGIVGLGYVGLPLAIRFSMSGYQVSGFDIDRDKVKKLNNGKSYLYHFKNSTIAEMKKNNFMAFTNFKNINKVDIILLCLPTPLGKMRQPDLSYLTDTLDVIQKFIKKGQAIIFESTSYPGTCEEVILPYIQKQKLKVGENFFLIYSPEREDPGNKDFSINNIPKIVSGYSNTCLKIGSALYKNIVKEIVPVSSLKTAELSKLLENIYRAVNIGLVNELKTISDKMDIDIIEVINAAATKPFGFKAFYPGPGLGGHCIPIDPFYLSWKAKEYNVNARFIELAGEVNSSMPNWIIDKVFHALNQINKSIKKSKILIVGLAYKENVDDLRESPALEIMESLIKMGSLVKYYDPFIPKIPNIRNHKFKMNSIKLTQHELKAFDLVIITTAHSNVNYNLISKYSNLIIDTRNVFKKKNKKIIRA